MSSTESKQLKDDDNINKIIEKLQKGAYDNYIVSNGILFKDDTGQLLLVVPKNMETEVIRLCHEQGHFATKKTEDLIRRQFFMSKLADKIKMVISNCIPCILSERKKGKQDGLLNPIPKGDTSLMTYFIDHLGHLAPTRKQYKYILSVIDGYNKFVCFILVSQQLPKKLFKSWKYKKQYLEILRS